MFKHFVAISNSYSHGIRWGWHYTAEKFEFKKVQEFLSLLYKKNGNVQIGTHMILTDSPDWDSVKDKDPYFNDVIIIPKTFDFFKLSREDNKLSAIDVSKYIISELDVTNLKLQKLLYLAYERILIKTGKKLFEEDIVAWRYGPVIRDVYDEYKTYGKKDIQKEEDNIEIIENNEPKEIPLSYLRILSSKSGIDTVEIVDEILSEFGKKDAFDLVDYTHRAGTPWNQVHLNDFITDDIIISCNLNKSHIL